MGKQERAPLDFLEPESPSQKEQCPWPASTPSPLHPPKYLPQTLLGLAVLSLQSVHTPFLAVVENKFYPKVSNHFTRVRDL